MAQIIPGYEILREIFPHVQEDQINEMIQLVEEQVPNANHESKIDRIYDLLSGINLVEPAVVEEIVGDEDAPDPIVNHDILYQELSGLYPDASEDYLLNYCQNLPPNTTHDQALMGLADSKFCSLEFTMLIFPET